MDRLSPPAPRPLLEALSSVTTSHWRELQRLRQAVLKAFGNQEIHDLRVASRRLRTAIELLKPWIGRGGVSRLRRPVRKLTRELGELRNLDEARSYLLGLDDDSVTPLITTVDRHRSKELRRIKKRLERLPCKRLERQLQGAGHLLLSAATLDSPDMLGWLSERNQALYRPIHGLLHLPELADHADERHRLRIAIKKWRYFSELLDSLCGRQPGQLVTLLKQYQTLLGDLNDREVFLGLVHNAVELSPAVRQRVATVITGQHQRLTAQFRTLLKHQPLKYQFMA